MDRGNYRIKVTAVEPLKGGTSSAIHRVDVKHEGRLHQLVLRQYTNQEWLSEEPDAAVHEAANLQLVEASGLPAPVLLNRDEAGRVCGIPLILMSCLPGDVVLQPNHLQEWLKQLAETLATIHEVDAAYHPYTYAPYAEVSAMQVPHWSSATEVWERAIEYVQQPWPVFKQRFIHRDYHPVNVLWQDRRISGIIDWPNACLGPAGVDIGHCRLNLAQLFGIEAADEFLASYCSIMGNAFEYEPYWDIVSVLDGLDGPPEVYGGWLDWGVTHLNNRIIQERTEAYLSKLVAQLG